MKDYKEYYSTNEKHYHTIHHIENLLNLWNEYKDEFKKEYPDLNEEALITAIKWHDSYYIPGDSNNELNSILNYMNASSKEIGYENGYNISIGTDPLVCLIIESTIVGYDQFDLLPELKVMHDLDWSGFNDYEIFKNNCEKICLEAIEVGKLEEIDVRRNQIQFYRKFAEKPLYLTKTFEKFNNVAKDNMLKLANELENEVVKELL
jgi:predicted metal-dependent HD superfamily phosphohydrolase